MQNGNALSSLNNKIKYTGGLIRQFLHLVNNPSQTYFPEHRQKGRLSIWLDNLAWIVRNKEINRFYYAYGLDRKDIDVGKEILSYREYRSIRDRRNLRLKGMNFNYACLLRDKFIFGQLLNSLQLPTPKNIALLDKSGITWLDTMKKFPLSSLVENGNVRVSGFCKKLTGIKGEGAFPLRVANGQIFADEKEISLTQFQQLINAPFLWQETIIQHKELSMLHPNSVNTMRILTFNNEGNIELFSAALRIGTKHRSVDNWGAGGIAVPINIETGTLGEAGVYKPGYGGRTKVHPDSGITLLGYPIPYFTESVELACACHRYFYGVHSIGWDIAVTPGGPVLVEGNEDWDGSFAMSLENNFKSRFLKMYQPTSVK
jgi:hypothetical protein